MGSYTSPPLAPTRSHIPSPDNYFVPMHVMEALMEEDMERLCTHREARSLVQFRTHEEWVFTLDHGHLKVLLRAGHRHQVA